jgi:hypothetical protein
VSSSVYIFQVELCLFIEDFSIELKIKNISVMNYIVMCRGVCVTCRRVLDWMIGFIDTLYTQLGTTGSYSAIAISTLYSSPLHRLLVSSVYYTLH